MAWQQVKPSLKARLLHRTLYKSWAAESLCRYEAAAASAQAVREVDLSLEQSRAKADDAHRALVAAEDLLEVIQRDSALGAERVATFAGQIPDESWFEGGAGELRTAWLTEHSHACQQEVFAAALAVHEAFARAAGQPLARNLRRWADLINGNMSISDSASFGATLWQSLFLVVPMVSSTFASMSRLLRSLPGPTIGWLIVDEAGQARPLEAIGALRVSQRALIVGDPAQLEPVVTTPDEVIRQVAASHDLPVELQDPVLSLQELADGSSIVGVTRGEQNKWVGAPLRAHQRCLDPMFTIANQIAYDESMVLARADGPVVPALGSCWVDVPRPAGFTTHWNDQDWAVVTSIYASIAPDVDSIGVISPFRAVAQDLVRLAGSLSTPGSPRLTCGTVHTFQGQERDAILVVLGGSSPGAIRWATTKPNLLNVAVTRAKNRLYVIGDYCQWAGQGVATNLANNLNRLTVDELEAVLTEQRVSRC